MKTYTVNEYLKATLKIQDFGVYKIQHVRKAVKCADGTTLSIQASDGHYCSPRVNSDETDEYTEVEVWRVSKEVPESWKEYGDSENSPYAYIPVNLVQEFVDSCGGIVGSMG